MNEDRMRRDVERLRHALAARGEHLEGFENSSELYINCELTEDCRQAGANTLHITESGFHCSECSTRGTIGELASRIEKLPAPEYAIAVSEPDEPIIEGEFVDTPTRVDRNLAPEKAAIHKLDPTHRILTKAERKAEAKAARKAANKGRGERALITILASLFLIAGLMAAGLSAYANYQAFSSSVGDPVQGRIWGWTGVIAAIVSFGGFTFVWWHATARRRKEAWRSLFFAFAGAITSLIGTQSFIAANNTAADAEIASAAQNRGVLEAQIADWRTQLAGIPPETRSVEGLEAYLAGVEQVGRTHQKPYRDAQNELGLAKRRDALQAKIEAGNAELLGIGKGEVTLSTPTRTRLPAWFFALMLELFSSQATSIATVALILLARGKRADDEKNAIN